MTQWNHILPPAARRLAFGALALGFSAGGAHAATTDFPSSVYYANGNVENAGALLGDTSDVATFDRGSIAVYVFDEPLTDKTAQFTIDSVNAAETHVFFRLGRFVNGRYRDAAGVGLTNPLGGSTANVYQEVRAPGVFQFMPEPFLDSCRAIGFCNAVVIGGSTYSAAGGGFTASRLAVSATPEISTWAMMVMAFFAVALRMKAARGSRRIAQPVACA